MIILNFFGDSALSAGCDSRSFNFESGGVRRVLLREPCGAHQRQAERDDDKSSRNSD